jgi:hypothetical protein
MNAGTETAPPAIAVTGPRVLRVNFMEKRESLSAIFFGNPAIPFGIRSFASPGCPGFAIIGKFGGGAKTRSYGVAA